MTKEVTKTTVKLAKMKLVNGKPEAVPLPDVTLMGNVKLDKAQKVVQKRYNEPVTVFEVDTDTKVYEMNVEDFIQHATVREKQEDGEQTESAK